MRIVSWNVNSIRARENRVLNWLDREQPDVLCMQELKCTEDQFPFDGFDALGYEVVLRGQKTYNGVAIASALPLDRVELDIPWPEDDAARGIAATVQGVRVVNLYVPSGGSLNSDSYAYKLAWLDHLLNLTGAQPPDADLLLCGDFNIAPDDRDVSDPPRWEGSLLVSPPERERFQALLGAGLHDALRELRPKAREWTWWDFKTSMFERGEGLRIDHHLVSGSLLARVQDVLIDIGERAGDKPSDHAPVTLVLRS
jgi:exodeoxyribonuclease-3